MTRYYNDLLVGSRVLGFSFVSKYDVSNNERYNKISLQKIKYRSWRFKYRLSAHFSQNIAIP